MCFHSEISGIFVKLLRNPHLKVILVKPYWNKRGSQGIRWVAQLQGLLIYISESQTTVSSTPDRIATILRYLATIDQTKGPVYHAYRRPGTGLRVEAWYDGRWFQIFTPIHRDNLIALSLN